LPQPINGEKYEKKECLMAVQSARKVSKKVRYVPVLKLPPLPYDQFLALRANIALNGILVPILVTVKGNRRRIIDGNYRKAIADELGYHCPEIVLDDLTEEDQRTMARALNLARRQLTTEQKRQLIADQLQETPDRSNRWIAKQLGVSHVTVASVRTEMEGTGQVVQLIRTLGSDGKYRTTQRHRVGEDDDADDSGLTLEEREILRAATQIRQRQNARRIQQQQAEEARALAKIGKPSWTITAEQTVVKCDLLIVDPPYGISTQPWEPENLETFTRDWSSRWSRCGADFIAIFWSQGWLFDGRQWLDESLTGYRFQQLLVWHANNNAAPKNRKWFKQSWEPILLYRRIGSSRQIITTQKQWDRSLHNFDCHIAPVPQLNYSGHDLKQHPAQKPVSVMRWLVHALSERGEKIVSLFSGVAPCGIAALQLGRRYQGIEINAKYRKIANARLAKYGSPA
jgi:ParB-like chromosome segregation protein Spo0J